MSDIVFAENKVPYFPDLALRGAYQFSKFLAGA